MTRTVVVGAGVFGVAAALELAGRGHDVTLLDQGEVPHPLAASTDVSKIVRADYGADAFYVDLMDEAFAGWERWNATWDEPPLRRSGFLLLRSAPMDAGFERDSHDLLLARGAPVERVDPTLLRSRFPAFDPEHHVDGYHNPQAGWAWSSAVVTELLRRATAAGVDVRGRTPVQELAVGAERVVGVELVDGRLAADWVVVAAGAWTTRLVPGLDDLLVPSGHHVVHLAPDDPSRYEPPAFPVWGSDISAGGWYGLPLHPSGVLKVGRHGTGVPVDPSVPDPTPPPEHVAALREFLARAIPSLADAPVVATRTCVYTDTPDGDFWIDRHPDLDGLVVASGGSGHGFKFAPVLGRLVADVVDDAATPWRARLGWRVPDPSRAEAARSSS